MKNTIVYLNRAMPADAVIDKHMDFASVFRQFQVLQLPFYKRPWFKWGMASVVVAAGVTLALTSFNSNATTEKNLVDTSTVIEKQETPFVNPPVDGGQGKTENFLLSSASDTVIVTAKGSKLFVPAGIAGNGAYELRVREFEKMNEIFLSGIPMDYDSAGQKYAFKSAGMIEVIAYRNNQPVVMQTGKTVKIELASTTPGNDFNVYYLDTVAKQWTYKGEDTPCLLTKKAHTTTTVNPGVPSLPVAQLKDSVNKYTAKVEKHTRTCEMIASNKPVAPLKADTSAYYFDIRFNPVKFPEMKAFKNAHFQVLPECTFFNSGFYSTKWSSVKVSEKMRGLKYIIHVSRKMNGKEVAYDIPVKPVYEGKSYDSAMTAFSGAFKQYENVYAAEDKKRQDSQKQLVVYREKHKNATVYSAANNSGIITVVKTENNMWANLSGDEKITRAFAADRFGVWNCDKPLPYKRKDYVEVTARDVTGHGIKEGMLYVGDVKNRAIFKYDEKERNKVGMEKEGKYIVWIIDSDEQLHFTKVDLTGKELPETKKLMLDMSISPQIPSNPLQLKKLMGI